MVTTTFYQKIIRNLEMHLIREANFVLKGEGYELMLFIPTDYFSFDGKSLLALSAKILDRKRERSVINEILSSFKSILSFEEFSIISSLKIIDTNAPLVRNLNFMFPFQKKEDVEYEVTTSIGDITLQNARLIRSSVLPNLITGRTCGIKLITGHVLAGKVLGIDNQYNVAVAVQSTSTLTSTERCQFSDIVSIHTYLGDNR